MVRTKRNNRYIKRASLRKIKKHKKMYGGEVQILHNIDDLHEYITNYNKGEQCDLLIQIAFENKPIVIKGRNDSKYPVIDVASGLADMYMITKHSWINKYIDRQDDLITINQCLDDQDEESRQFYLEDNIKLRSGSYDKLLDAYNTQMAEYNDYIKKKKEYDKQFFKGSEPTKVTEPSIKKPVLQKEVGSFCLIQIKLKKGLKKFECTKPDGTVVDCNFENIKLSKIAEDYNKTLSVGHEETIETNEYLKLKYYLEIDPKCLLLSFYIGWCIEPSRKSLAQQKALEQQKIQEEIELRKKELELRKKELEKLELENQQVVGEQLNTNVVSDAFKRMH